MAVFDPNPGVHISYHQRPLLTEAADWTPGCGWSGMPLKSGGLEEDGRSQKLRFWRQPIQSGQLNRITIQWANSKIKGHRSSKRKTTAIPNPKKPTLPKYLVKLP